MAEDRLDDAIDAVVRAVDRIERATRRQGAADDAEPESGEAPDVALEDLRPPATGVAPGHDAWEPDAGAERPRKKDKHKKKKARAEDDVAEPAAAVAEAPVSSIPAFASAAAPSPADLRVRVAAPAHAPAEVHELVGRIIARTQELDDHLEAARVLRTEITELVARLAAAATQQR